MAGGGQVDPILIDGPNLAAMKDAGLPPGRRDQGSPALVVTHDAAGAAAAGGPVPAL